MASLINTTQGKQIFTITNMKGFVCHSHAYCIVLVVPITAHLFCVLIQERRRTVSSRLTSSFLSSLLNGTFIYATCALILWGHCNVDGSDQLYQSYQTYQYNKKPAWAWHSIHLLFVMYLLFEPIDCTVPAVLHWCWLSVCVYGSCLVTANHIYEIFISCFIHGRLIYSWSSYGLSLSF